MRTYVLGARPGNIGGAIADVFHNAGHTVKAWDGAMSDGRRPPGGNLPNDDVARQHGYTITTEGRYQWFSAPSVQELKQFEPDTMIITVGKTYKGHFSEIGDNEIWSLIRANLILPLEAARRFVQAVEDSPPYGVAAKRIIFIGSYAHDHPFTNGTLYCVAKAGLDMAARALGWELTGMGYRVHTVHPFHVQGTPMWEEVEKGVMESKGLDWEQADAYNRKDLKMPDLCTPAEVAEVVLSLCSVPAMQWTSGTSLRLYGGSR